MVRVYKYRLYPSRQQDVAMRELLWRLRELYNAALENRRDAWKRQKATITANQQMLELVGVRVERPEYAGIHTHLLQDAITRLDRAFSAFFRRRKSGEKPGYPRFKGRDRYRTFTFKDAANHNGVRLAAGGKRVKLAGIGNVKVKLHRPVEGCIKQVIVTLAGDGNWYIAFVCNEVPVRPLSTTGRSVGIDMGITTFAALSDGTMVDNPRPYEAAQRRLSTAQRCVSRRRNKRSNRRRKAVRVLARQHHRVACARLDFHHKTALDIVRRFDCIAVEDLNIKGLARMRLAKQVHDAGWGQFARILESKAESAAREFFRVDPRGTSQECSACSAVVRKTLAVRVHRCPACGLVEDRDINAAKNIERLGHSRRGGLSNERPCEPRSPDLAVFGR